MNLEIKEKVIGSIKWAWWFLKEELLRFYQTGELCLDL